MNAAILYRRALRRVVLCVLVLGVFLIPGFGGGGGSEAFGLGPGGGRDAAVREQRSGGLSLAAVHVRVSRVDRVPSGVGIRGRIGETVPLTIDIRGQDKLNLTYWGNVFYAKVRFTPPDGTQIVAEPEDDGQEICDSHGRAVECPAVAYPLTFRVRIVREPVGAEGSAQIICASRSHSDYLSCDEDRMTVPLDITGYTRTALTCRIVGLVAFFLVA